MDLKKRRVFAPPGERRPLLGHWDGVPDHVPVLCPSFLPLLAAVSPKSLSAARWFGGRAEIERRGVALVFSDRETIPQAGPLAVKTLLLAYAVFTAGPHAVVKGSLPEAALTVKVAVWDAALLFGLEGVKWSAECGRRDSPEYERIAAKLQNFAARLRAALSFLPRVSARIGGKEVPLIEPGSFVAGGKIVFRLSPEIGLALAKSGAARIPAALFRLPMKERTAFALGLKICSFASIRRNYEKGRIPDRLRIRTLLEATALPVDLQVRGPSGKTLRKAKGWREWTQDPIERAMLLLRGAGILSCIGYAPPMCFGEFETFDQWTAATVVFSLSRFPRISPPEEDRHGIA